MNRNRQIVLRTGKNASEIAHGVDLWLEREKNLATKLFHLESGAYEIYARHRRSDTAKLFGLDVAVRIRIEPAGERIVILAADGGVWRDKLIVGAVSLVVLWPLALCAGYGACRQGILLADVRRRLNSYSGY